MLETISLSEENTNLSGRMQLKLVIYKVIYCQTFWSRSVISRWTGSNHQGGKDTPGEYKEVGLLMYFSSCYTHKPTYVWIKQNKLIRLPINFIAVRTDFTILVKIFDFTEKIIYISLDLTQVVKSGRSKVNVAIKLSINRK